MGPCAVREVSNGEQKNSVLGSFTLLPKCVHDSGLGGSESRWTGTGRAQEAVKGLTPDSACRSGHRHRRMKLSCVCARVTVTGSRVTLALARCEQWPLGLYPKDQDTQDVGGGSLHTPCPM